MRKCENCEIEKKEEDFPIKNPNCCKRCRARISEIKYKNSEKGKESTKKFEKERTKRGYFKDYYFKNPEKLKKLKNSRKEKNKKYLEKIKAQVKKHNLLNPLKYKARQAMRRAVLRKKINKPNFCMKCGLEAKRIEGHHNDYTKPLEVLWLCVSCHRNLHKELNNECIHV